MARRRVKKERQPPLGRNGLSTNDQQRLRGVVDEINHALDERASLDERIRDIKKAAKAYGFDGATVALVVRERRMDAAKRQERDALADVYRHALGMLADTPLGLAALGAPPAVTPATDKRARGARLKFLRAPPPAADDFQEGP
jgi:uncharacterized protein (UPF0335 family)